MEKIFELFKPFILLILIVLNSCNEKGEEIFNGQPEYPELSRITLLDGPFKDAMMRTNEYLRSLDPDRFLHYFRLNAGLDTVDPPYGGWEQMEVRGHTIGHYLSACAMMYASCGDTVLRDKAEYIIDVFDECQKNLKTGYLSAFPEEHIDRAEKKERVWAPYYVLHKIMAGLYDSYILLNNKKALDVLKGMADWLSGRCEKISYREMQEILDHTEQGGMNEVLFNLYAVTGDDKYLKLGQKFYQESYFRPILSYYDSLKGQHVNSFIPNVTGLMREYELTGKEEAYRISKWFWNQVVTARSYVTGGTSNGEGWGNDPFHMHTELGPASHETCCTYNMLKLTRHLFREDQEAAYMDYYERALLNGILPTQDTVTNMTMYYVPMQPGYYKTFSTAENSMWCCTGTGMENFSKTGEAIYMTGNNKLYVNLYIASELSIEEMGFKITQETAFPEDNRVLLKISATKALDFNLCLRIPGWTTSGYSLLVNNKEPDCRVRTGNYIEIDRVWRNGDQVELVLPMKLKIETLPATHEYSSLMYGPVVLAGVLSDTALTVDKTYGNDGPYMDEPQEYIPAIRFDKKTDPANSFNREANMTFMALAGKGDSVRFIPFYKLFNTRYMIYFRTKCE